MIALILKDIYSLRKIFVFYIPFILGIMVLSRGVKGAVIMQLVCVMIPLITMAIATGIDYKSKFGQFAFSMPIKKSSYVLSKLFFPFAFSLIASIYWFVWNIAVNDTSIINAILLSIFIFEITPMLPIIQLPFILKFGAEKGRLLMVVIYFIIFALISLLKEQIDVVSRFIYMINHSSVNVWLSIAILLTLAINVIGIFISIFIMKHKEF